MKLPLSISLINREVQRRRQAGEAEVDAEIVDFCMTVMPQSDGTFRLRTVFMLSDGTSFPFDSPEVLDLNSLRRGRLH